jgi:Gamma-glutamyltransferase
MDFSFPYRSQRMPVMGRNVVATSQPLAAQAGLQALAAGGNAVDAALAAAIALTVVEPTSNGIGGDLFAIVWDGTRLHGLNASGRSSAALDLARYAGLAEMPLRGWDAVTVPGAVSGWVALADRFARLSLTRLAEPAVRYARDGFLVSPITAHHWNRAAEVFAGFDAFAEGFLPGGRAPQAGEAFAYPAQALTLEEIAATAGESFYRGRLAEAIAVDAARHGAAMTVDDLAGHRPDWVAPIATEYHGVELHELPPNGQGIAALIALGILRNRPEASAPLDSADWVHVQLEAMKLALADLARYSADPDWMDVAPADLLDDAYLAERAALIDMQHAGDPGFGTPQRGGTVYVTAADADGMMVSLIQSNYYGFGSGIVIPGTGIAMQNRGAGFVLEAGHPNALAPRKRPLNTIIPGFLMCDGAPLMSFGVMGGAMQAQGHVQMTLRTVDHDQNPQEASDAPRWRVDAGRSVAVEWGFDPAVAAELRARGHEIAEAPRSDSASFGGAQLIRRVPGGYIAGSDHRKDGQAVAF